MKKRRSVLTLSNKLGYPRVRRKKVRSVDIINSDVRILLIVTFFFWILAHAVRKIQKN